MIILVCGGRNYNDFKRVTEVLDSLSDVDAIVHGEATGADLMAGSYAKLHGIPEIKMPANWRYFNRSAGPIRNGWMIRFIEVGLVVAFPGGSGTADMIEQARQKRIKVLEVR